MEAMVGGLLPVAVLLLAVVLGCCLWFSWRGARHLQAVADGLDTLAQGGAVQLPTTGFAGELAEKLNETAAMRSSPGGTPPAPIGSQASAMTSARRWR